MRIVDLTAADEGYIRQAAELLVEGFKEHWPDGWPDMDAALEEVREALEPGKPDILLAKRVFDETTFER